MSKCNYCGGSGSVETELYEGLVNCSECQQYTAVQIIPIFVDMEDPPEEATYIVTDDLLEVDWVKRYTKWKEFNNFCQSKDGKHLMVENKDGTWWWVVARVDKDSLDLPVVRYETNHGN